MKMWQFLENQGELNPVKCESCGHKYKDLYDLEGVITCRECLEAEDYEPDDNYAEICRQRNAR